MKHPSIVTAQEIEHPQPWQYPAHHEPMGYNAAFGKHFGFKRLGIHEQRLLPGRRTSMPHAESLEDEFVYVIAGTPDVWLDGVLYRLDVGDTVGFPAGEGLSHTFINNTDQEVRLLVVGDTDREGSRIVYPVDPDRKALRADWWDDAPKRPLGGHDGRSDLQRKLDEDADRL